MVVCRRAAFNVAIAGWLPCGTLLALVGVTLSKDEARMQARLARKVGQHTLGQNDVNCFEPASAA